MPGVYGATASGLDASMLRANTLTTEIHRDTEVSERPPLGLIHHGDRDPTGYAIVDEDAVAGVCYGALTNATFTEELVKGVLRQPHAVLRELEGPFALACMERASERVILATDKLGTRQLYFSTTTPVVFGSELATVCAGYDAPSINSAAVSDLLLMGHVWGEKTLLEGVARLRPGSFLEIEGDTPRPHRYWTVSVRGPAPTGYPDVVSRTYARAVEDVLDTIGSPPGIWLSGGLDSRTLAGAIADTGREFSAASYDRPIEFGFDPICSDTVIGRRIADRLGIDHTAIRQDPARMADRIPTLVGATDGQVAWHSLVNLGCVFDLTDEGPLVMIEGPVPLLTGEKVEARHLGNGNVAAATLMRLHARTDPSQVRSMLTEEIDPGETFARETVAVPFSDHDGQVIGATFENYHPGKHFTGNKVARTYVGTRETLVDGELLNLLGRMPRKYRRRSIPFTNVPHVPSPMKLALARRLDNDLGHIPYSMTKLPPMAPYHAHGIAFAAMAALQRLRSKRTLAVWLREEASLIEPIGDLIAGAAARPIFDGTAVTRCWEEHVAGDADHTTLISAITTVELFHRDVIDPVDRRSTTPAAPGLEADLTPAESADD